MADTVKRRSAYETRSKIISKPKSAMTSATPKTIKATQSQTRRINTTNLSPMSLSTLLKARTAALASTPEVEETANTDFMNKDNNLSPIIIQETQEVSLNEEDMSFKSTAPTPTSSKFPLNKSLSFHHSESFLKIVEERDRLKRELETVQEENSSLKMMVEHKNDSITKLENEMIEMKDVIINQTEELEKLKEKNLARKKLKKKTIPQLSATSPSDAVTNVSCAEIPVHPPPTTSLKSNTTHRPSVVKRRNVIIVGDSHVRHLASRLQVRLSSQYRVSSLTLPNATFQQALPLLAKRVNSLDKKDFVIFIAGTNNINLKTIPEFDLSPLVNLQKQTNVFVSEIPYRHNNSDSYDVNEIIYQVNLNLYNRLYHTDVKMIKLTTFEYSLFTSIMIIA